tara:strand:- start:1630 stop:2571 length:942 start_codon:yes stop_codon:yes gene_type:complete
MASGNFCTWNALNKSDDLKTTFGNTMVDSSSAEWNGGFGSMGMSSGKWYWEVYEIGRQYNGFFGGIIKTEGSNMPLMWDNSNAYLGQSVSSYGSSYAGYTRENSSYGGKRHDGSGGALSVTPGSDGDIWQFAFDADGAKLWIGKNNTWSDSGDPANGNNPIYSSIPSGTYVSAVMIYGSTSDTFHNNWGADSTFGGRISAGGNSDGNYGDFKYAPPSGFLALCTANMPDEDVLTSTTFVGNGNTDGPFVYLGGVPGTVTINSNAVTFGTHALKMANGFKVISSSSSYNNSGATMTVANSSSGANFKYANAQTN